MQILPSWSLPSLLFIFLCCYTRMFWGLLKLDETKFWLPGPDIRYVDKLHCFLEKDEANRVSLKLQTQRESNAAHKLRTATLLVRAANTDGVVRPPGASVQEMTSNKSRWINEVARCRRYTRGQPSCIAGGVQSSLRRSLFNRMCSQQVPITCGRQTQMWWIRKFAS